MVDGCGLGRVRSAVAGGRRSAIRDLNGKASVKCEADPTVDRMGTDVDQRGDLLKLPVQAELALVAAGLSRLEQLARRIWRGCTAWSPTRSSGRHGRWLSASW
jgi:hypothetical protein